LWHRFPALGLVTLSSRAAGLWGKPKFDPQGESCAGVRDVISIDAVAEGAFTPVFVVVATIPAAMQGPSIGITWDEVGTLRIIAVIHAAIYREASKPGKVVRNDGDANARWGCREKIDMCTKFRLLRMRAWSG